MKHDQRRLYYHPKKMKLLTYTPLNDEIVIEETENYNRRALKKSYIMPSKRGYKLVGPLAD